LKKIKESQRQLRILGYLKDVQMKTIPVPDANNQVDLEYQITEDRSAAANFSVGYGTAGPVVGVSVDQKNFLGTGRNVGASFQQDRWAQGYSLNYFNPYFTPSGIGQGFGFYFQRTTPSRQGVSRYATNTFGGENNYDIPFSDNSHFNVGVGYQQLDLTTIGQPAPSQLSTFVAANGRVYREARFTLGWNYNGYDQYPMPNKGIGQNAVVLFAAPGGTRGLSYYKVSYSGHLFLPLFKGFTLSAHTNLGYGSDYTGKNGLPFFENFYAGGLGTTGGLVRGYDIYSLGPKDSTGKPFGGNALVSGNIGLILPYPLSRPTLRTTVFVDAGNVYYNSGPAAFGGTGSGPMRFSTGVSVEWNAYLPITIAIAKALNPQRGDAYSLIPQFTVGLSV
ncbi:MAG: BamA/TamA family outer membrane protein, partial [Proteobacteria bacterium]|nr:BamA/TamA family outer membrane protein [Pseudomonadota bacterium]